MTKLSPAQIAVVAAGAGFTGTGLRNAVAVALAESGGRTDAVNVNHDSTRSRDRGLWQINSRWHPEVSDAAAFNPESCAKAAYRISSGGKSWSAWSTWKNGAAQAQMGRATMAVSQAHTATAAGFHLPSDPLGTLGQLGGLGLGGMLIEGTHPGALDQGAAGGLFGLGGLALEDQAPGGPQVSVLGSLQATLALLAHAGGWMADSHNWSRVAMVGGGTVAILLSLRMIAESGAAGSTAASVAAIPGKAAKVAVNAGAAVATGGTSAVAKTAATAAKATKAA